MITRRQLTRAAAALPFATPLLPTAVRAQTPGLARILVGFTAGGPIDVLARRVADKLRGNYAASVVVENKPGAAGQIAIIAARDSAPDGSALLLTPSSMLSIYPYTYPKLQYKLEDVMPVSLACQMSHGFAVGPAVPETVRTLGQYLTWAKANVQLATYGTPGAGSMPHMIGVLLSKFANASLRHVPYRGSLPAVQDMLGAQIGAFCGPTGDLLPHIRTGKVRLLATSGKSRSTFSPEVPTIHELGYPVAVREWYGFFLPAKSTPEVSRRAAAYLQPALSQPDLIEYGKQSALEVQSSTPSALSDLLAADADQWRRLIKQVGFTAES